MEITCLNRVGVPRAEIAAHQRISAAFARGRLSKNWKGYAAFSLTRKGGGAGNDDFDLVLVTHAAMVVIELKNWNGKKLISDGEFWYVDGEKRPSPLPGVELKAKKLAGALRQQLGDDKKPFVASFVCLHGNLPEAEFLEDENDSVLFLDDLLAWSEDGNFRKFFWRQPKFSPLQHLRLYDRFFAGPAVKPKVIYVDGFRPETQPMLKHPADLYAEYRAYDKNDGKVEGLLRQWNFAALGTALIGESDRAFLGLREQNIYDYVEERDPELATSLLRVLRRKTPQDVTLDYVELFRLPSRFKRLVEFSHAALPVVGKDERLGLVKALLARFANLHDLSIAHRDVGEHCLWIDRPAGVLISGFPAAHYPSMKTVGSFREQVKIEHSLVPEDTTPGAEQSPYKRDVFMLATVAHTILFNERPPKVRGAYEWSPRGDDPFGGRLDLWFGTALHHEPAQRFPNARAMLDALNAATKEEQRPLVDPATFLGFTAASRERDYASLEYLKDSETESVFRARDSGGDEVLVKVWFQVGGSTADSENAVELLAFLERCRTLKACEFPGVQRVCDFGLSRGSLLLVLRWVPGNSLYGWLEAEPKLSTKLELCRSLLNTISHLHALRISHGDIHPGNIVVTPEGQPVLIDALDYRRGRDAYTTEFLPSNYKSLSPEERDRFGVAFVLLFVLRSELKDETSALPTRVRDELTVSMSAESILSLEPLISAFDSGVLAAKAEEVPAFRISVPATNFTSAKPTLYDDNGVFHIAVRPDKKGVGRTLFFRVTGVGCELTFSYDPEQERVHYAALKAIAQSSFLMNVQRRDASVRMQLVHDLGGAIGLGALPRFLMELPELEVRIRSALESDAQNSELPIRREPVDTIPDARQAWRALIDAEQETFRTVVITGEHRPNPRRPEQVLIPYVSRFGVIDYEADDEVAVEFLRRDGNWATAGVLSLRDTTFGDFAELALEERRMAADLRPDTMLRLVSKDERASYTRRKDAVDRILDGKATVPSLFTYLDGKSNGPQPTTYPEPTDSDLLPYAGILNEGQRRAFRAVIGNGPISLLQGPPGTGKTTFIACLLHYLIHKQRARRILLVSQAHEAVNNALEKSAGLFRNLGSELNAVRLGPDSAVPAPIRHIHSSSLEQAYRERFKAEQRQRVASVGQVLGLPPAFCLEMVDLHQRLATLAVRMDAWYERQARADDEELARIELRLRSLRDTFVAIARERYDVSEPDEDPYAVIEEIERRIILSYGILSGEAIDRLRNVIRLAGDWIDSLGSREGNFLEFLAKSRTVVAGTCVGVGFKGAGVTQNIYDWVIIDEAARAAPSEIAVALQTGKRILLVGDHKQLPPMFTDDVKAVVQEKFGLSDESCEKLFISDFERLFESQYGTQVGASLDVQYRMAPAIGRLVSSCFYGHLKTGRTAPPDYYSLLPPVLANEVTWVDTGFDPAAREFIPQDDRSASNDSEARAVLATLRQILGSREFVEKLLADVNEDEPAVAVICMYDRQRALIEKYKSEAEWMGDLRKRVKVDSVDSYQGKENRIVLVSTVRNNPKGSPGFLRSPNRVNVAVSRAMERLVVFGAVKMWTGKNSDLPLGKVLSTVRQLEAEGLASVVTPQQIRAAS